MSVSGTILTLNRRRAVSALGCSTLGTVLVGGALLAAPAGRSDLEHSLFACLVGCGGAMLAIGISISPTNSGRWGVLLGSFLPAYFGLVYGWTMLGPPTEIATRSLARPLSSVDLTLIPLSLLATVAGYHLAGFQRSAASYSRLLIPSDSVVGPKRLQGLFVLTVACRLYLLAGQGFGYLQDAEQATQSVGVLSQYISLFGSFGVVIVGIAVVANREDSADRRLQYRPLIIIGTIIEIALGVVAGTKSGFLLVVIMVGVVAVVSGTLKAKRLAVIGLLSALIVFPFNEAYRELLRPADSSQATTAEAPGLATGAAGRTFEAFHADPSTFVTGSFEAASQRLREVDRAAVAVQTHDSGRLPFQSPKEILERILAMTVPRVVWPNKPIDLYGLEVGRNYYGSQTISAASLSPAGDAYRYGGLPSVSLAFLLLGMLTRFLDSVFDPRRNPYLVVLLIAAVPMLRKGDLASIVTGSLRNYIFLALILRLAFASQRHSRQGVGSADCGRFAAERRSKLKERPGRFARPPASMTAREPFRF